MALYARVNEFGFLEAPYRKVVHEKHGKEVISKATNEIVYLSADDERKHYITHAEVLSDNDRIIERKSCRPDIKGEFIETEKEKIEFVDIVPRQVVGAPLL